MVETKISGRTAATTLFVVCAKQRDGSENQIAEGQNFKLFLAPGLSFFRGSVSEGKPYDNPCETHQAYPKKSGP